MPARSPACAGRTHLLPDYSQGWEWLLLGSQTLGSNPAFKTPLPTPSTCGPGYQVKILLPCGGTTALPCCLVRSHQAVGLARISHTSCHVPLSPAPEHPTSCLGPVHCLEAFQEGLLYFWTVHLPVSLESRESTAVPSLPRGPLECWQSS